MFARCLRIVFMLLTFALGSGCVFARKRPVAAPDLRPLRLGRVALINEADRFALIETFSTATPAAGAVLRIYEGDKVAAELHATGVRRRPFLVADLITGSVAKGDIVFQPQGENGQANRAESTTPPNAVATAAAEPKRGWWRWLFPFGRRH